MFFVTEKYDVFRAAFVLFGLCPFHSCGATKSHHGVFLVYSTRNFSIVFQGKLWFVQKRITENDISFFFSVYRIKERNGQHLCALSVVDYRGDVTVLTRFYTDEELKHDIMRTRNLDDSHWRVKFMCFRNDIIISSLKYIHFTLYNEYIKLSTHIQVRSAWVIASGADSIVIRFSTDKNSAR